MEKEIPEKFAIHLDRFDFVFKFKVQWEWGGVYRNLYKIGDEVLQIGGIVELAKQDRRTFKNEFSQRVTKSNYFFPLLLNYLAVVEITEIQPLLDFYFDKFLSEEEKQSFIDFLDENLQWVYYDFKNCVSDIAFKKALILEWLKTSKVATPARKKYIIKVFRLSDSEIKILSNFLVDNRLVTENARGDIEAFFRNDFNRKVEIEAPKNKIADLISRIAFRDKEEKNNKNAVAIQLGDKVSYHRKGTFVPIGAKNFETFFSDSNKTPSKFKRFLIDQFPELT